MPVFPAVPSTITPTGASVSPRDRVAKRYTTRRRPTEPPVIHAIPPYRKYSQFPVASTRRSLSIHGSLADGVDQIGRYGSLAINPRTRGGGLELNKLIFRSRSYRF